MKLTLSAFMLVALVPGLLLLSAGTAYGQMPTPHYYFFVEVKDTAGQAVTDVTLTVSDVDGKQIISRTTDQAGTANVQFSPVPDHHLNIEAAKSGYVSAQRVLLTQPGSTQLVSSIPNDFRPVLAIVLRKTPTTSAERQAAEAEERKGQLLLAAKRGDPASLRKLLQAGVKPDTLDDKGVPVIAWAALAGDAETVRALLIAGADVHNKDSLSHQALLIYLAEGLSRARATRAWSSL